MKIIDFRLSAHHSIIGLPLALAVALLGGCSNSDAGSSTAKAQAPTPTVTATPTVTGSIVTLPAPATVPTTAEKAPAPKGAGVAKSDVVGRRFDLGSIVRVENVGGEPVIILDRWTSSEIPDDSKLAAQGVTMTSHTDARFANANGKATYRIPVAHGAVFTYLQCNLEHATLQSPSTLENFTRLKSFETRVILLTLDTQGRAVKAVNDPPC